MVFRPTDLYVITSTFFTFFTFFQNPKNVTFYVFCRVSYVFSNYGSDVVARSSLSHSKNLHSQTVIREGHKV